MSGYRDERAGIDDLVEEADAREQQSAPSPAGGESEEPPELRGEVLRWQAQVDEHAQWGAFRKHAAEALADEAAVLVRRGKVDSRAPLADALLDYRSPPFRERSDRIATLEAERDVANALLRESREWLSLVLRASDEKRRLIERIDAHLAGKPATEEAL